MGKIQCVRCGNVRYTDQPSPEKDEIGAAICWNCREVTICRVYAKGDEVIGGEVMANANEFVITERKCEMCKGYGPGAATKMVLDKTGETIAKFHLCGGCIEEMRETYKDVINKSTAE